MVRGRLSAPLLVVACSFGVMSLSFAACGESEVSPTASDRHGFAPLMVLLRARCQPCHTTDGLGVFHMGTSTAADAAAYAELVGPARGSLCIDQGWSRVQPGEPQRSLLYLKVQVRLDGTDPPCGGPMPITRLPPLPPADIEVIRRWIADGAAR